MLFGPIFSVELVTTARRARYLVTRLVCAAFLGFILVVSYQSHFDRPETIVPLARMAEFAQDFFIYFAYAQIAVVLLLTPALTAGTISLERERRTIEYLFATDLRNHEIVLGKLAARLVVVMCQVLAGLPILSIAMLLGGIEPQRLYMVFAVTLSTTLALAAFGIAISVWAKRSRDAVLRAYVVLFAFLFVPLVTGLPVGWPFWLQSALEPFWDANPLVLITRMMAPFARPAFWADVAWMALYHGAIGVVCLASALIAVRRVHLKSFEVPTKSRGRRRRALRTVGDHPMLWKELFAQRSGGKWGIVARVALLLIAAMVVLPTVWAFFEALNITTALGVWTSVRQYLSYAIPMGSFLSSLALLVLAARASGAVTAEKEHDTWVSLLCTPLTPREIISAKVLGTLYEVRWLVLLPLIVYLPAILLSLGFVFAIPFVVGTFLVLCLFVTNLGVLVSLRSKNTLRAMGVTLAVTIFLGGGYLLCCCMPLMINSGPGRGWELMLTPCMPFLLSAPGMCYVTMHAEYGPMDDGGALVAYVFGMLGYGVGALVLFLISTANFEEIAGRTAPRAAYYPREIAP
jgi:ABC-type transport system involved in multi-copper enzyme maturation permease subunit